MSTLVTVGESIEGSKVDGSSRKPLEYKGIALENGIRVHRFISRFNTKSKISEELGELKKISEAANVSLSDIIRCDDALLRSVDKRYSADVVSNASGTHKATAWSFARQTNVMITRSHQEIENALQKRMIAEARKLTAD